MKYVHMQDEEPSQQDEVTQQPSLNSSVTSAPADSTLLIVTPDSASTPQNVPAQPVMVQLNNKSSNFEMKQSKGRIILSMGACQITIGVILIILQIAATMMAMTPIQPRGPDPGDYNVIFRLAGGNSSAGRVEVYHDGTWGTICDDDWGRKEASMVCRTLGFRRAYGARHGAWYGQGQGSIHLDNVHCPSTNNTDRLSQCTHNGWGTHNCGHSEDASAVCTNNTITMEYDCSNNMALHAFYRDTMVYNVTLTECIQLCVDELDFNCKSIEYRGSDNRCTLSMFDKPTELRPSTDPTNSASYCTVEGNDVKDRNVHEYEEWRHALFPVAYTGVGFWCGILYIISGGFGVGVGKRQSKGFVITFMVLSIIVSVLTVIVISTTAVGIGHYNMSVEYDDEISLAINILLLLAGLVNFVISVISSALSCGIVCCSGQSQSASFPSIQYMSGTQQLSMNGQPMMMAYMQPSTQAQLKADILDKV